MKRSVGLIVALVTFTLGSSLSIVPRAIRSHRLQELKGRETILRAELLEMRRAIDKYSTDREVSPRTLDELVKAGYLNEIPVDPITEKREWEEVITDLRGQLDIVILEDVRSVSTGLSSEGTPYREW